MPPSWKPLLALLICCTPAIQGMVLHTPEPHTADSELAKDMELHLQPWNLDAADTEGRSPRKTVSNGMASGDDRHPITKETLALNGDSPGRKSDAQEEKAIKKNNQVEAERSETASSEVGPFEGPEKLLELWFAPNAELVPARPDTPASSSDSRGTLTGLRAVPHSHWYRMLDQVKCKVLSIIHAEHVDAFLLSESSMFVWPHKIILKTCGTTGLLLGLDSLLKIAKDQCGFNGAWRLFYSRKAFMFPAQQFAPHTSWENEIRFLDKRFAPHGTAQVLGENPWYLYHRTAAIRRTKAIAAQEDQDTHSLNGASQGVMELANLAERDNTLEILMTGLGREAARQFEASEGLEEGHKGGMTIARQLSMDAASLLGRGSTDAYLFSPCGFSANLLGGPDDSRYGTIHVTPEASHSFASFETNLDYTHRHHELRKLVQHFLHTFQPQKTTITFFNSHIPHPNHDEASSDSDWDHKLALLLQHDLHPFYSLVEDNNQQLDDYKLAYISLERVQEDTSS